MFGVILSISGNHSGIITPFHGIFSLDDQDPTDEVYNCDDDTKYEWGTKSKPSVHGAPGGGTDKHSVNHSQLRVKTKKIDNIP